MTADFAITIPVGPGPRPWLIQSLRSLSVQQADVAVALYAAEHSPDLDQLRMQFQDLIVHCRIGADSGQSDAINQGWNALDARYYGWLNDDDMLNPHAFTRVLQAFADGADVVHGQSAILQAGTLKPGYGDTPVTRRILRENTIAQPSAFIAGHALDRLTDDDQGHGRGVLDTSLHYGMDWDLWRRLFHAGASFMSLPHNLSVTRWNPDTKTASGGRAKYAEYLTLMKRDTPRHLAYWSILNAWLHTQASADRPSPLANGLHKALSFIRPRPKEQPDQTLELYHFSDEPQTICLPDMEAPCTLEPGQVVTSDQQAVTVPWS